MAVQGYIGWPIGVNRTVLDATTISVGDDAQKKDELEDGHKISIQKSAYIPERFNVKMSFDWETPVEGTNKTEYQLFTEWYKYKHKYGTVPFEFPNILYSSETGIPYIDPLSGETQYTQFYKITTALEGSKSGGHVAVNMTWEAVYSGVVSIETPEPSVDSLDAHKTYLDVIYSDIGSTAPVSTDFTLYKKVNSTYQEVTITGFAFDGISTVRLYHESINSGTFTVAISDYEDTGDHESSIGG